MNLSTIVVGLVLLGIVGWAIRSLVSKKGTCSCGCSGCSQQSCAHKHSEV